MDCNLIGLHHCSVRCEFHKCSKGISLAAPFLTDARLSVKELSHGRTTNTIVLERATVVEGFCIPRSPYPRLWAGPEQGRRQKFEKGVSKRC